MILTRLRRGLLAGLVAGLLAGLFGFALGEPVLERAVELEERTHDGEHADDAVFSRGEQKAGLFLATTLYGTAVGSVFGLVSTYFRGRVSLRGEWTHSLALAGAIFAGFVLLPFLKYPPNPPGVGADPETLTARTVAFLAMAALSLLSTFFAWRLARELEGFATPVRHLLIGMFLLFSWGLLLALMPGFGGSGDAPAELVWSFRLSSLGMQAVLWTGLGCAFGLLGERAGTRVGRAVPTVVAGGEPQ